MLRHFLPLVVTATLLAPLAASAQGPSSATTAPPSHRADATILAVDAAAKTVTLRLPKRERTLAVADNVRIYKIGEHGKNAATGTWADLAVGDKITARITDDKAAPTVIGIHILATMSGDTPPVETIPTAPPATTIPSAPGAPSAIWLTGTITATDAATKRVIVSYYQENVTLIVTDDTKIYKPRDGRRTPTGNWTDLTVGRYINAYIVGSDAASTVIAIRLLPPAAKPPMSSPPHRRRSPVRLRPLRRK